MEYVTYPFYSLRHMPCLSPKTTKLHFAQKQTENQQHKLLRTILTCLKCVLKPWNKSSPPAYMWQSIVFSVLFLCSETIAHENVIRKKTTEAEKKKVKKKVLMYGCWKLCLFINFYYAISLRKCLPLYFGSHFAMKETFTTRRETLESFMFIMRLHFVL